MPSDPLEDAVYLLVQRTIEDNYRDTTGGYIVSPSAVASLATSAALAAIEEQGKVIVDRTDLDAYVNRGKDLPREVLALNKLRAVLSGTAPQPSESPQGAHVGDGEISGRSDTPNASTGLSDVQMVIADRYGTRRITLPDATPSERAALLHAVELENLRAELEAVRAALAEEREITADYRRVNKAAMDALDRVRALHRVHSCAVDGHVLDRTPIPCASNGFCSCGRLAEHCEVLASLDSPEGTTP